ncbi:MAG TPA: hypothetical protein VNB64_05140 [Solirubrobacteraceae bacterium]|nr:hypothetical protein [Solirubrobacteraceae bacterium]
MATTETASGTEVVAFTDTEFSAYLDREVRRDTPYDTFAGFREAFRDGTLDLDDPGVERLVPLLHAMDSAP